MSASSTSMFLTALFLLCCILVSRGHTLNSDKYNDNQMKASDSRDGSGSGDGSLRSFGAHRNLRTIYGFRPRMLQISRSKIPIELDLLVDNEADGERTKRFDDYGHMRFGKRGGDDQFDDYGHMRFGR